MKCKQIEICDPIRKRVKHACQMACKFTYTPNVYVLHGRRVYVKTRRVKSFTRNAFKNTMVLSTYTYAVFPSFLQTVILCFDRLLILQHSSVISLPFCFIPSQLRIYAKNDEWKVKTNIDDSKFMCGCVCSCSDATMSHGLSGNVFVFARNPCSSIHG